MAALGSGQIDRKLFTALLIVLGVSLLFPEYIAPLFVFALYIFFLIHFKRTNRNAKLGQLGKAFFAYMCYMVLSAIWSNTHILSGLIGLLWMGCFLSYILVANIVNTNDKLKNAITAVNISAGITGLIGIAEFVTYNLTHHTKWFNFIIANPIYYNLDEYIFNLFPFDIVNNVYPSRATATFANPLVMATYLVMATPFCAFGSVYFKHSVSRKISRVCLLLSLGGLLCTESRGAYIAVGLSIITLLISNKRIFKKLFPFIVLLAVSLPVILSIRYKNSPKGDFLASNNARLNIWLCSIDIFKEHPILGLGCGTENIHQIMIERLGVDRAHAHNIFLEILDEGGIVGAIFASAVIFILIRNLYLLYKLKDYRYRPYAILYSSAFVGFMVMSLFEHTLQTPKEMMMFFMVLGFVEATLRMATDKIQLADDEKVTYKEINLEDFITDEEEKEKELV